MTGMGFCHNFGGLATARFFLGLAECEFISRRANVLLC